MSLFVSVDYTWGNNIFIYYLYWNYQLTHGTSLVAPVASHSLEKPLKNCSVDNKINDMTVVSTYVQAEMVESFLAVVL